MKLRLDVIQIGSNISSAISFHRIFMMYCYFYRQLTNQKCANFDRYVSQQGGRTGFHISHKIHVSIIVYLNSKKNKISSRIIALGPPGMEPEVTLIVVILIRC